MFSGVFHQCGSGRREFGRYTLGISLPNPTMTVSGRMDCANSAKYGSIPLPQANSMSASAAAASCLLPGAKLCKSPFSGNRSTTSTASPPMLRAISLSNGCRLAILSSAACAMPSPNNISTIHHIVFMPPF